VGPVLREKIVGIVEVEQRGETWRRSAGRVGGSVERSQIPMRAVREERLARLDRAARARLRFVGHPRVRCLLERIRPHDLGEIAELALRHSELATIDEVDRVRLSAHERAIQGRPVERAEDIHEALRFVAEERANLGAIVEGQDGALEVLGAVDAVEQARLRRRRTRPPTLEELGDADEMIEERMRVVADPRGPHFIEEGDEIGRPVERKTGAVAQRGSSTTGLPVATKIRTRASACASSAWVCWIRESDSALSASISSSGLARPCA